MRHFLAMTLVVLMIATSVNLVNSSISIYNNEDVWREAEIIIIGKILDPEVKVENDVSVFYGVALVRVDQSLKKVVEDDVILVKYYNGGMYSEESAQESPILSVGFEKEEYVMLALIRISESYYELLGGLIGKMTYDAGVYRDFTGEIRRVPVNSPVFLFILGATVFLFLYGNYKYRPKEFL
jgi:hypothetical protein